MANDVLQTKQATVYRYKCGECGQYAKAMTTKEEAAEELRYHQENDH